MKFKTSEGGPCLTTLEIEASPDEVKEIYRTTMNLFVRNASIPGFRKGKAPLDKIRQRFASEIVQECSQRCFSEFYPKGVEEKKLRPLGVQAMRDVKFAPETGFSCAVDVETMPEFKLPKYRGLKITKGRLEATDEEVDAAVKQLREAYSRFEDAKEGDVVAEGDFVEIDFSGTLDGKPLAEVVPEQKAIGEAKGYWTQVLEGRFLPELLDAIKGMKAGETKEDIGVKFPDEVAPEPLKGRECSYQVSLKSFRRRFLPDDAELAKDAQAESFDALRVKVREGIEKDLAAADLNNRRQQAFDLLLEKADFDVPPSLVRHRQEEYIAELARRMGGVSGDYVEQNRDKIIADAETSATRQVRYAYIMLAIAREEKFELTPDDFTKAYERLAAESGEKPEDVRAKVDKDAMAEHLLMDRAMELVLSEAK